MSRVFICYRREDSAGYAGRIYDRLAKRFGERQVFMDIDTIAPGEDWVETVDRTIKSCDAMIVVIGRNWLTKGSGEEHPRISQAGDHLRLELETALAHGVKIVPVLVGGGQVPKAEALPESVRPVVRRQAVEIREPGFNDSVERLIGAIPAPSKKRALFTPSNSFLPSSLAPWVAWVKELSSLKRFALGALLALMLAATFLRFAAPEFAGFWAGIWGQDLVTLLGASPRASTANLIDDFGGHSERPDPVRWHAPPEWRLTHEESHNRMVIAGTQPGFLLAPSRFESFYDMDVRFQVPITGAANQRSVEWILRFQSGLFHSYSYRFLLTFPTTDYNGHLSAALYKDNQQTDSLGDKRFYYHPFRRPGSMLEIHSSAIGNKFTHQIRYIDACDTADCPDYNDVSPREFVFQDPRRTLEWGLFGFIAPPDHSQVAIQEVQLTSPPSRAANEH